jgi:hypothetical protein
VRVDLISIMKRLEFMAGEIRVTDLVYVKVASRNVFGGGKSGVKGCRRCLSAGHEVLILHDQFNGSRALYFM